MIIKQHQKWQLYKCLPFVEIDEGSFGLTQNHMQGQYVDDDEGWRSILCQGAEVAACPRDRSQNQN